MKRSETTVSADRSAAAVARRFVGDSRFVSAELLDDVALLVSELVTNAVKYTDRKDIQVRLSRTDQTLRVEVENDGPGFADPTQSPPRQGGGLGLRLVDRLSDRWGIETDGTTTVWFELDEVPG